MNSKCQYAMRTTWVLIHLVTSHNFVLHSFPKKVQSILCIFTLELINILNSHFVSCNYRLECTSLLCTLIFVAVHRESLSTTCLTVNKYCCMKSSNNLFYEVIHPHSSVNCFLITSLVKNLVKFEIFHLLVFAWDTNRSIVHNFECLRSSYTSSLFIL